MSKPCGIINIGNTCYMNSCLQLLSNTPELLAEINKLKTIRNKFPLQSKFFIEWKNILTYLSSNNEKVLNPKLFLSLLQINAKEKKNDNFLGFNQEDATEFLIFILDIFHDVCKINVEMKIKGTVQNNLDEIAKKCYQQFINYHKNEYSLFTKLFYYMSVTSNYSIETNKLISQSFQSNFVLDIPIPTIKNCSIYDCLDLYFKDSQLSGDNGIIEEKTNIKHNVIQKVSLWNSPQILIISFKRFSYTGRKNNQLIWFPIDILDISKYVSGYNNQKSKYSLYGICNHSGVLSGGHYTAYIKKNNKWYLCNDSNITEIHSVENNLISSKSYCLFYRKKN